MSAVDAPAFFVSELRLVSRRRRNQAGLAVLAAVPIIIAVAMKVAAPSSSSSSQGPEFFGSITSNGYFVALAALAVEIQLLLPIAVATIAGDSVAGEANQGTLRYLLTVPVDRTRLLAVKFAAIVVGAFVATMTVATAGLLAGWALFGAGPVTLLSGSQASVGGSLLRLIAMCAYLAVCLSALGAIGLFVSTLTEQPMGATIAITIIAVTSWVLGAVPQLDWLHPYLLTNSWTAFGELMRSPIAWEPLRDGLLSAAAYMLIFLSAAWARFTTADVSS